MTEREFIEIYGATEVGMPNSPLRVPLTSLLQMEAAFCPVDSAERTDPGARVAKLAQFVGHDALQPQHRYLVPVEG